MTDDGAADTPPTDSGSPTGGNDGVLPAESRERVLTLVLLSALVAALLGVVYVVEAPPGAADSFTEFYVLGPDGNTTDYPTNLTVGETGELIVGVRNKEGESVTYAVVANLSDRQIVNRTFTLPDGQTREWSVSFEARSPGRQQLRILLFKGERAGAPDQHLRLWVTVREPPLQQ